jgi:cyclic pyranopterin phosphate synthase
VKATQPLLTPEIKQRLSVLGLLTPVPTKQHDGPAQRFKFKGAKGEIGFISALSQHFCSQCNRLRLTASGQLRPCLLSDYQEDLKTSLRAGCSDQELADLFIKAVHFKPLEHKLRTHRQGTVNSQMCSIGG